MNLGVCFHTIILRQLNYYYVGDELSKAYASCDIFLMSSDTETLGLTIMEAAASGVPSIAGKYASFLAT